MESKMFSNGWSCKVSSQEIRLPVTAVDEAIQLIKTWAEKFPRVGTWVGDTHDVPSLVVRVEGTWAEDTGWRLSEIEDRPCGIGICSELNSGFASRLREVRATWPSIQWVQDSTRVTDDALWLGDGITLEQALQSGSDTYFLVRSRPEHSTYHQLEPRAISTVSQEGNKRPLVDMGLADIITWREDLEEFGGGYIDPPISGPCVVKPLQGTRARGVTVCLDGCEIRKIGGQKVPHIGGRPVKKRKRDTTGLDGLERFVRESKILLRQPFHMPMRLEHLPDLNAIYRFFFAFHLNTLSWVPLGGVYNASESLIVHGEKGVVFGPLTF